MTTPVEHPVIGTLNVEAGAILRPHLDDGFDEYITPTMFGLAKVDGHRIEVLAMSAFHEGRGDGGRFINALLANYNTVIVWEVGNPRLEGMLLRRGFRLFTVWHGGNATGYRWDNF